jgi:ferredoxin
MTKVALSITSDCISCFACSNALPEVFAVPDGSPYAIILAKARLDGKDGPNIEEQSAIPESVFELMDAIEEAAAGCPTESIKLTPIAGA